MTRTPDPSSKVVELKPASAPCPICTKPAGADFKPFCSKRCADVDLGRWLGEGYRLPDHEVEGFGEAIVEGFPEEGDGEGDG